MSGLEFLKSTWWLVLVGPVFAVAAVLLRSLFRKKPEVTIEFPQLARIQIVPMLCRLCNHPLQHEQLIVYYTKNTETGWRSHPAHAHCAVMVRDPGDCIRTIHGKAVATNWDGTLKEPLRHGQLLLSPEEWDKWSAGLGTAKVSVKKNENP